MSNAEHDDKRRQIASLFERAVKQAAVTLPKILVDIDFPEDSDTAAVTVRLLGIKGQNSYVAFVVRPDNGIYAALPNGDKIGGIGNLYDGKTVDAAAYVIEKEANKLG